MNREKYYLVCPACGAGFADDGALGCRQRHEALLRSVYTEKKLVCAQLPGMLRFSAWLPFMHPPAEAGGPVCYRSSGLARHLDLPSLYISFNGYWPERNADLKTCSFKELEAVPALQRASERTKKILIIASAGNTGRAFCQISAQMGLPVIVVVPAKNRDRIWTTCRADRVLLVTIPGDYSDAIAYSRALAELPGVAPEGGASNVARRDGMGTVMLDAAVTIGRIPDYYLQAVGSGTGAIAAWEAALRLSQDGRFGIRLPQMILSQNIPFIPMVNAWKDHRRCIIPEIDMPDAKASIASVLADVLTNRSPPYGICGGLFDCLTATEGTMLGISNDEALEAGQIFSEIEGIDADPAALVTIASLFKALNDGIIDRKKTVLLNVTGGGYRRVQEDYERIPVVPSIGVNPDSDPDHILKRVRHWVKANV
jgi:cysteate synthase